MFSYNVYKIKEGVVYNNNQLVDLNVVVWNGFFPDFISCCVWIDMLYYVELKYKMKVQQNLYKLIFLGPWKFIS